MNIRIDNDEILVVNYTGMRGVVDYTNSDDLKYAVSIFMPLSFETNSHFDCFLSLCFSRIIRLNLVTGYKLISIVFCTVLVSFQRVDQKAR